MEKKKVYVAMSADFIHAGHLNIIGKARELGEVTVGLLTDSAIASYKRLPMLNYEVREIISKNIKGVSFVTPQNSADYTENLEKLKPDYVVHGDDWKVGVQSKTRQQVIDTLKKWEGELIEVPYTNELDRQELISDLRKQGTTPQMRRSSLKRLINSKPIVRILEVHNGITGLIAENTKITKNNEHREFDGMWESSLTDSTSKGKPDTGSVDITSRISTIDQILDVTTKPMIVDADNGGYPEHFSFAVRTLERLGISAVIIEDKIGFKRNSLFGTSVKQTQDDPEIFAEKISLGKRSQITREFMIIARIESLILGAGHQDAINRARIYVDDGADGIMIPSKDKNPKEIVKFCKEFKEEHPNIPIIVVPTTYSTITESELAEIGVNVVIYANHMLRSAFPAMIKTAETILISNRCHEANQNCMSVKEIINLIPEAIEGR